MSKPVVYIRVDGSPQIGLGHIYRCVALAQMLEKDFEITFWSVEVPDNVQASIKENFGYGFNLLSGDEEFFELVEKEQNKAVTVILDGYHFDTQYQRQLKELGVKIVCIDDIHNTHFVADAVINHGPGISNHAYSTEKYTKLYLGPEYALLRKDFIKLTTEEHSSPEKLETAFVCFGGADPMNFTKKALKALIQRKGIKIINVVTGGGFQHPKSIDGVNKSNFVDICHYHNVGDQQMASLMKESDFAIVPSSTILYEVIAARLPAITGYYVDNQSKFSKGFSSAGAAIGIGKFSKISIENALRDLTLVHCRQIQKKQGKIIDGNSSQRIRRVFQELI